MTGATTGGVKTLLRIEGFCVLLAAALAYSRYGLGWKTFALFFLAPDLSFLGYLGGPVVGACSYNAAHSYAGAVLALFLGVWLSSPLVVAAGLIWCAHLGFDRALGYGLKYASGFGFTHLGPIGRARQKA
ncbi:MAG: DUF4260 domain-containing protein [Holophagaceae bacterium]|nr:DUF4260 domain-containing protein [Holophagaceae bacterium]